MFENMNFNVKALLLLTKLNKFAVRSVPKIDIDLRRNQNLSD